MIVVKEYIKQMRLLCKKIKEICDNNLWILGKVWQYAPIMFMTSLIKICANVYGTYVSVNLAHIIFESIEKSSLSKTVCIIIAIFCVTMLTNYVVSLINIKVEPLAQIRLTSGIREEVICKTKSIKYSRFSEQEFFNEYTLGLNQIDSCAIQVVNTISSVFSAFVSFITVCILTYKISFVFTIFGVIYVLIDVSLGIKRKKFEYQKQVAYTSDARKRGYVNWIVYQPEFAADIKIYPRFLSLLLKKYREATASISEIILSFQKKIFFIDQLQQIAGVILKSIFPWIIIAVLIFQNNITVPEATVLIASMFSLPENLGNLVNSVAMFQWHSLNIAKLRNIYNLCEDDNSTFSTELMYPTSLKSFDIDLQNVTFAYSQNSNFHIDNINMSIYHGEKIAFVGRNGSGKTTLTNLIIKLYDVNSGSIRVGDVDIRNIPADTLRSKITLLSQNYVVYKFTIAENILMHTVNCEEDIEKVWYSLKQVGLYDKIKDLPNGINTYITQEFSQDGVYFSGGECQKLSLARIYAGQYECIILDESTSALDPISENEIYETVFRIFKNKTVIMISHRLGTITHMDRIFYMKNGRVTETGTHTELMELHGEYFDFFNAQAEKYRMDCNTGAE